MAATISPFGIFIEAKFKNESPENPCAVIKHEEIHWKKTVSNNIRLYLKKERTEGNEKNSNNSIIGSNSSIDRPFFRIQESHTSILLSSLFHS